MAKKQAAAVDVSWAADKVERRSVDSLVPYASNSRTHSDEQIEQIVQSIKEWGWTVPVLIDENGGIIAGHGRVMAAKQLELAEVPVMIATGWSEAQKRAYVIADNKLALNAGWDNEVLAAELKAIAELGFDLSLSGFDESELVDLIGDFDESDLADLIDLESPNGGDGKLDYMTFGGKKVPVTEEEVKWLLETFEKHVESFGIANGFVGQTLNV